jgi:hypothetical protein
MNEQSKIQELLSCPTNRIKDMCNLNETDVSEINRMYVNLLECYKDMTFWKG